LEEHKGYTKIRIVGHSLGGGTASLLHILFNYNREKNGLQDPFRNVTFSCSTFGVPPTIRETETSKLAASVKEGITNYVHNQDAICRLSLDSWLDLLVLLRKIATVYPSLLDKTFGTLELQHLIAKPHRNFAATETSDNWLLIHENDMKKDRKQTLYVIPGQIFVFRMMDLVVGAEAASSIAITDEVSRISADEVKQSTEARLSPLPGSTFRKQRSPMHAIDDSTLPSDVPVVERGDVEREKIAVRNEGKTIESDVASSSSADPLNSFFVSASTAFSRLLSNVSELVAPAPSTSSIGSTPTRSRTNTSTSIVELVEVSSDEMASLPLLVTDTALRDHFPDLYLAAFQKLTSGLRE
jgi:hypothetical protein